MSIRERLVYAEHSPGHGVETTGSVRMLILLVIRDSVPVKLEVPIKPLGYCFMYIGVQVCLDLIHRAGVIHQDDLVKEMWR